MRCRHPYAAATKAA
jgi:hypothetical protein